jgi:hypothetical protein
MVYNGLFPLLGFPHESNACNGNVAYSAYVGDDCRIVMWKRHQRYGGYAVNLYRNHMTDNIPTHQKDRYSYNQEPIPVADALEAQLAIFYLIQKHLPQEVIDDINNSTAPGPDQTASVRVDPASREAVE